MNARSASSVRVLYVAGLPRSGSTVLGCVLGKLPGTIFVGELAYFWRRFAESELCSCGTPLPDCPFWSTVVGKGFGQVTLERARELNKLEQQVIRRQRMLALAPVRWSTRWSKRIHMMLDERDQLCKSIFEVADAECIVDSGKEVTFGAIMARLGSITFSAVHLVRDPRGVAFSWLKEVRSDSEPGDMPRSTAVKTAARWMTSNFFVQVSLKILSNAYFRVRYEDLVAYPDATAKEISRATSSSPPSSRWANPGFHHVSEHHLVGSNPGVRRHLGSDLRLTLDEEWRTRFPPAQQWLVTAVCAGLMTVYDYPLRNGRRLYLRCT